MNILPGNCLRCPPGRARLLATVLTWASVRELVTGECFPVRNMGSPFVKRRSAACAPGRLGRGFATAGAGGLR